MNLTLREQVFEARYESGYRYLDRCGDVMVVLEQMLTADTGKVWMTAELAPKGARLKCPELDMNVVIDAFHMTVVQQPTTSSADIGKISEMVIATITGRFDLHVFTRLGHRRMNMIGTDSIEQAEERAANMIPVSNWPLSPPAQFKEKDKEIVIVHEHEDGSKGYRFALAALSNPGAPEEIDERLKLPPRLLPKDQHKALVAQLKMRQQREKDPIVGVLLDFDYYELRPQKLNVRDFIDTALNMERAIHAALGRDK